MQRERIPHNSYRTQMRIEEASELKKGDHITFPRKVNTLIPGEPLYTHQGIVSDVNPGKETFTSIHFGGEKGEADYHKLLKAN